MNASATSHWRIARWSVVAAVLAAPLFAMQLTDQVAWTVFDFAVAAILLVGAALTYELAAVKLRRPAHRIMLGAAILGVVLLVWAQGAVGVF